MVDHVSNKRIRADGYLFWAVLMGTFILGSAYLEYLGWLLASLILKMWACGCCLYCGL